MPPAAGPPDVPDPAPAGPLPPPPPPSPATSTRPQQGAHTFACRSCGAQLRYLPGTMSLSCPYCGAEQPVPQAGQADSDGDGAIDEHGYEEWLNSPDKPTGVTGPHVVACPRCAANVTTDDLSLACPFCSAPIVIAVDPSEQIVPEGIVPFTLTNAQATAAMRAWTGSRWFAPNGLKRVSSAERINGTYVPHWTYDAQTETHYTGMRGDYYYTTETYTDGQGKTQTRMVQHTRWWPASGTVARGFDDVLVIGSSRLAPDEVSKLEPWSLTGAEPFQRAFLSGYSTLRYDIEPAAGLGTAKERMRGVIDGDVRADIGGDVQQVHDMDTRYWDLTFKLMLLPVWVAGYLYAGKTYTVYINAHDGHVVGERPYSVPKIVATVLAALLLLGAIAFFYQRSNAETPEPPRPTPTRSTVSVRPSAPTATSPARTVPGATPPGVPVPTGSVPGSTGTPNPTYWTG
ncbi:MAG: hypothetical protein IPK37_05120 [Austwickia sp.]|nr:MAG: hypothetical protein IPK37_05120 [Austwickia sp.]